MRLWNIRKGPPPPHRRLERAKSFARFSSLPDEINRFAIVARDLSCYGCRHSDTVRIDDLLSKLDQLFLRRRFAHCSSFRLKARLSSMSVTPS